MKDSKQRVMSVKKGQLGFAVACEPGLSHRALVRDLKPSCASTFLWISLALWIIHGRSSSGAAICKLTREGTSHLFFLCGVVGSLVCWDQSGFSLSKDRKKERTEAEEKFLSLVGFFPFHWQRMC